MAWLVLGFLFTSIRITPENKPLVMICAFPYWPSPPPSSPLLKYRNPSDPKNIPQPLCQILRSNWFIKTNSELGSATREPLGTVNRESRLYVGMPSVAGRFVAEPWMVVGVY